MKKSLSLFLALVILLCTFCAFSNSAFASTLKDVKTYKAGDKFTITLSVNKKNNYTSSSWKNAYYAKFVPLEDCDYEFKTSALDFYGQGGYKALITDSKDNVISYAYALGEDSYYINIVGHLKKGKTYYYLVQYFADVEHTVKLKVQLKKHTHKMIDPTVYAPDAEYLIDYEPAEGEPAEICAVQGCTFSGVSAYYNHYSVNLDKTAFTYDGKEKEPTVVFYDMRGKKFIPDFNVKVRYKDNVKIGKGKAEICTDGVWTTRYFKINPKNTEIKKLTAKKGGFKVNYKKIENCTGYQIQYSLSKNFKKSKKTITLKNKSLSKTVTKLKRKKTYFVRVRSYKTVNKTKYYSSWSKTVKIKTK